MGRFRSHNGERVRLSVSDCAVRLSVDIFRAEFLKIGRTRPPVLDVTWTNGQPVFREASVDSPPTKELLSTPGYVGQVTLVAVENKMYTRAPRWFFACGGCGYRRSRIYAAHVGAQFLCGTCLNVTYPSAQRWDNVKRTGCRAGFRGRDSKNGGGPKRQFWRAIGGDEVWSEK